MLSVIMLSVVAPKMVQAGGLIPTNSFGIPARGNRALDRALDLEYTCTALFNSNYKVIVIF
jgi:hypothetical protein